VTTLLLPESARLPLLHACSRCFVCQFPFDYFHSRCGAELSVTVRLVIKSNRPLICMFSTIPFNVVLFMALQTNAFRFHDSVRKGSQGRRSSSNQSNGTRGTYLHWPILPCGEILTPHYNYCTLGLFPTVVFCVRQQPQLAIIQRADRPCG
jgi:hypothetical protein